MRKKHLFAACLLSLLTLFATVPQIAEEECERSGGENGEYCKECKWSWWYFQDTCQDVEHSAHCSCENSIEDCWMEEGTCDYIDEDCAVLPEGRECVDGY